MVLGETCRMAATSADRRKVAVLGARRADWLCIGTSLDALGAGGASPPPDPTSSEPGSRVLRGSGESWCSSYSGCHVSDLRTPRTADGADCQHGPRQLLLRRGIAKPGFRSS